MSIEWVSLRSEYGTLYNMPPSKIATLVQNKLRDLDRARYEIISVAAVPDYHHMIYDGGVKDIVFGVRKNMVRLEFSWHTTLVIADSGTMYGWEMDRILEALSQATANLEKQDCNVRQAVFLTDKHMNAGLSGDGGFDGVKNIILCYYL